MCGRVGHITPACRSKAAGKPTRGSTRKTKWLSSTTEPAPLPEVPTTQPDDSAESADETVEESLFVIRDTPSSPPYHVELHVNDQPLTMEVDTGAAVSLAPESAVAALLSSAELQPTNIVLKTYTGEQIPVKGVLSVTVKYGQQSHRNLKLLVIQGSGPSLMGRDWLKVVRLDWRTITKVTSSVPTSANLPSQITALQDRYQEVFSDTLGTISPFQAKLSVTKDAQPKFFKPRPVPLALKAKVESELDRLTEAGVLEKVPYSE